MHLDGVEGDLEPRGDLLVGRAGGDQPQNLDLALAQRHFLFRAWFSHRLRATQWPGITNTVKTCSMLLHNVFLVPYIHSTRCHSPLKVP